MISWKFKKLDKNSDNELNDVELQPVKRELDRLSVNISRSCSENILNLCNTNKDNFISRKEWRHCFGFKREGIFIKKGESIKGNYPPPLNFSITLQKSDKIFAIPERYFA